MAGWYVRPAVLADADALAGNLRDIDWLEMRVAGRQTQREGLIEAIESSSMAWSWVSGGTPVILGGVAPFPALNAGAPWVLGADVFEEFSIPFLRTCRTYIKAMHAFHPFLTNFTHKENSAAIRWLRWCGFEFGTRTFHIKGEPFIQFMRFA